MVVSVIIVTKNQKKFLERTIPVLQSQNFSGEIEIIVVDSGSTDGAYEYAIKSKVKLVKISPDNFNFARAFNTGAKKATGEYLIRLSGDAIPIKRDFVTQMISPFSNPKVGGVYGRYTISGRSGYGYPDYWHAWRFPKELKTYHVPRRLFMGLLGIGGLHVYDLAGGCCAVRKNIWTKRSFNEKLIAGEDAEYAWFLHLIGYDIVCNPDAVVLHEHKINRTKTTRQYSGFTKWQFVFTLKILGYWLGRLIGKNPYESAEFKN